MSRCRGLQPSRLGEQLSACGGERTECWRNPGSWRSCSLREVVSAAAISAGAASEVADPALPLDTQVVAPGSMQGKAQPGEEGLRHQGGLAGLLLRGGSEGTEPSHPASPLCRTRIRVGGRAAGVTGETLQGLRDAHPARQRGGHSGMPTQHGFGPPTSTILVISPAVCSALLPPSNKAPYD